MKTKDTLKIRTIYLNSLTAVSAAKNTPRIARVIVPILKVFMLCCRMVDYFGGNGDGMRRGPGANEHGGKVVDIKDFDYVVRYYFRPP